MHTLDILMSTYNGQKYIKNQIESIIAQNHDNWLLIVRDDGSCDQTCELLNNFSSADKRILVTPSQNKNIGVVQSYLQLLQHSSSPYFMFADQDDLWLPEKINLTLHALTNQHTDTSLPRLVYSDLQVVDSDLRVIHPSFLKYQRLKPAKFASFRRELLQNIVTGCTLGGNAALREKALQVMTGRTESVIMHVGGSPWLPSTSARSPICLPRRFSTVSMVRINLAPKDQASNVMQPCFKIQARLTERSGIYIRFLDRTDCFLTPMKAN